MNRVLDTSVEENAIIGALLIDPQRITDVADSLTAQDFHHVANGAIYGAMGDMWAKGERPDAVTVAGHPDVTHTTTELNDLLNQFPSVSSIGTYAATIIAASRCRRIAYAASQLAERALAGEDPDRILNDTNLTRTDRLIADRTSAGSETRTIAEFLEQADASPESTEWLAPGLVRRKWRIMIVGEEGVGKMVLLRQIGQHLAAGMDPLSDHAIPPRRVLVLDAENGVSTIRHQIEVVSPSRDWSSECGDRLHIFHTEAGLDLTSRNGKARLERAMQHTRPDVLIAGPIYKLFRRSERSDLEQVTIGFLETLDDLRERYDCAVILEHHMAKGASGAYRSSDPFGSSALLRWPEMGLAIRRRGEPTGFSGETYDLERFRGSREPEEWPSQLVRRSSLQSSTPAWSGIWRQRRAAFESPAA